MKFGVFMAPFHLVGENPTLALGRDLEIIEHLDRLGFDEAWIGEHHSGGYELIADPPIMIAAAAQRTKRIMLGSGVVDLPLHHPFMLADRFNFLDHVTRGRAMLGVGSGALKGDTYMMGIDFDDRQKRTEESIAAIMGLLRGEGPVTMETDWFTLNEARLQLAPYTKPHLPVAVAGSGSTDGTSASGKYGLGLLTHPRGEDSVAKVWSWVEESARTHGQTVSRADWRMALPFHLAEDREEAMDDVRKTWMRTPFAGLFGAFPGEAPPEEIVELAVERGGVIIGTPDDAIEALERLQGWSGGFGGFLGLVHELASYEKTVKSYELFARYVAPRFQGQYETVRDNNEWVAANGLGPGGRSPRPAAPEPATKD